MLPFLHRKISSFLYLWSFSLKSGLILKKNTRNSDLSEYNLSEVEKKEIYKV